MRALAVGLLLASGCNQIFGLNDNLKPTDAAITFHDAAYWPMQLTWQLVADSTGAVTFPRIDNATVQIGPIDPADGPMTTLAIDSTGTFLVPTEVPNNPYRLVYTIDSLPTEIQSTLHTGHFVVPMVGRTDREPTPSNALMTFDPVPLPVPNPVPNARIMTVGLWTSSSYPNGDQINLPFDWNYQMYGVSMAGTQGSLRNGDLEVVCSTTPSGDVTGYAIMNVDHLVPNGSGIATAASAWVPPPPTPPTFTTVKWITPNGLGTLDPAARLTAAVNDYASSTKTQIEWAGVIPSSLMPSFVQPIPGDLDRVQLAPLSTNSSVNPHTFVNPFVDVPDADPAAYPTAAFVKNTTTRTVGSVTLTSGFQGIGIPASPSTSVDMHYSVGMAHFSGNEVTLTPKGGPKMELRGADGTIVIPLAGAKLVDLTFGIDISTVDDCVVTIYQLSATNATPVRRLLLQQPPISNPFRIDASVFAPGTTYTLGVVCRKGQTGIATGDYTLVSYPYLTSTLYTPTFTVTP